MNATTLPWMAPRFSWKVKMSARIWQGCSLVREGIDGGNAGIVGELLDVALREGAEDGAVDHPAQHARGVLDRLAAAKLDFAGGQEDRLPAQLADADLEGHAGAGGGFGEQHGPGLTGQRLLGMPPAFLLEAHGVGQDGLHVRPRQCFNA